MTVYSISATYSQDAGTGGSSATVSIILLPGSLDVRVMQYDYTVDSWSTNVSVANPASWTFGNKARRNIGGTASGGTLITPTPMRQGAAAASATCRYGIATTSGGTSAFINALPDVPYPGGGFNSYVWPQDLVISPGSMLVVSFPATWTGSATTTLLTSATLYFEELKLSWPY